MANALAVMPVAVAVLPELAREIAPIAIGTVTAGFVARGLVVVNVVVEGTVPIAKVNEVQVPPTQVICTDLLPPPCGA